MLEWATPEVVGVLPFAEVAAVLLDACLDFAGPLPPKLPATHPAHQTVMAAEAVGAVLRAAYPEQPYAHFAYSILARRAGALSPAMEAAEQACQLERSWPTLMGVALARRDAGHVEAAIHHFEQAFELRPEDEGPLLDAGDLLLRAERLTSSREYYARVLERIPRQEWALASMHYLDYLLGGSEQDRLELLRLRGKGNVRARVLAMGIDPELDFVNRLPRPTDPGSEAVRRLIREAASRPDLVGGVYRLEAPVMPSLYTAFRVAMRLLNRRAELRGPDPRGLSAPWAAPEPEIDWTLYEWADGAPQPNLPAPPPAVEAAVLQLAADAFHPELWEPQALGIAVSLGRDSLRSLLGLMVHPPLPPAPTWDALDWVQRVVFATALVISHLDSGWMNSARRRALHALALGSEDWTAGASLVAMAWRARVDQSIRQDVENLFAWLQPRLPSDRASCLEYPLWCAWQSLGSHGPQHQELLDAWSDRLRLGPDR